MMIEKTLPFTDGLPIDVMTNSFRGGLLPAALALKAGGR
jgi:hypothetical protein